MANQHPICRGFMNSDAAELLAAPTSPLPSPAAAAAQTLLRLGLMVALRSNLESAHKVVHNECPLVFTMACPPPTGRLRPAHVLPVSVRPSPDVQVRRNVTSALELAAQGGLSRTPITLSLRKSHEELRTARRALRFTLCMIRSSLFVFSLFWMSDASMKIFQFGVYLVGTDFPM
ncbi:B-cell lymphoma/leukemia 11A [Scomber scombrus]|uniref:B-cell lymphoma/leukemia 11A n=1 Tax=Scomber scombrus TaxID=13677 RepID=A0AAV1NTB8_SCOSC